MNIFTDLWLLNTSSNVAQKAALSWAVTLIAIINAFKVVLLTSVHQQGHGRRHQTQPGPMDPMRSEVTKTPGGSRGNNVWWRDENSSISRERRGERCSVYPKCPPAAYNPIAASLGAGPGQNWFSPNYKLYQKGKSYKIHTTYKHKWYIDIKCFREIQVILKMSDRKRAWSQDQTRQFLTRGQVYVVVLCQTSTYSPVGVFTSRKEKWMA